MNSSRKWRRVESEIIGMVGQAEDILKAYGFPTSSPELMEFKKQPQKRLVLEAVLVIHGAYYLQQAIENNKADEAAMRMISLIVAYSRMTDLRDVPESEDWKKIGMVESEVYIKSYNAGLKNLLRNKTRENIITPEKILEIEKRAIELRKEDPDFLVYQIKAILAKGFNVSESTIQQMKVIPKRVKRKKK